MHSLFNVINCRDEARLMEDLSWIPQKETDDRREENQLNETLDCTKYSKPGDMMFLATENHVSS